MTEVKVSIILPAYNAEKYISKSIKSVLNQSYKNLEIIILNDGSIDNTENLILKFTDSRIKYIKNSSNLGLIETLNRGFLLASGNYIARIDADDIAHPKRIELQVVFLQKLGTPGIVGSNAIIIDAHNNIIKIPRKVHLDAAENFWVKFRKNPILHPTVMISKEIVLAFNPFYHSQDKHVEDYAAWLRINKKFPIYNISRPLLFYRMHDSNITKLFNTSQTTNMIEMLKNSYREIIHTQAGVNSLKSLIFLKLIDNDKAPLAFNEIVANGNLFIEKYGNKNFIQNDLAYSIFNIGLKSGRKNTIFSIKYTIENIGFLPLIHAAKKTMIEALRAIFLKYYYRFKYSRILKETL